MPRRAAQPCTTKMEWLPFLYPSKQITIHGTTPDLGHLQNSLFASHEKIPFCYSYCLMDLLIGRLYTGAAILFGVHHGCWNNVTSDEKPVAQ